VALDNTITGLHHITVIAGDAQENLDFYAGVLGMRLVKKTVNQDVPGTYHLFYADGDAHAGTDLTFFPWPDMPSGQRGVGLTVEVALAVPVGSLEFWVDRLAHHGIQTDTPISRFGERLLTFADPHGLRVALVETADDRQFTPWSKSSVAEPNQIRGLHGVRLLERSAVPTIELLTSTLGFEEIGREDGWRRFALPGTRSGRVLDIKESPNERQGTWGTGSVHHIAWRVPDDSTELEVQRRLHNAGRRPTQVIDRFWFKSVYFREPGGALFEIATDGPGFGVDEPLDQLGARLVLPPWLEPQRAVIEAGLPPLREPEPIGHESHG
jgi:glyoxalase family protein